MSQAPLILEHCKFVIESNFTANWIFIDDNAPPHRSRAVLDFKRDNIPFLNFLNHDDWPAVSPDLNVIEHVWAFMKAVIRNLENQTQTMEVLEHVVLQTWDAISQEFINNLVNSMTDRIRSVILANGFYTRF